VGETKSREEGTSRVCSEIPDDISTETAEGERQ